MWDKTLGAEVASVLTYSEECSSDSLSPVCIDNIDETLPVNFAAKVTRGHDYELRLKARCEVHNSASAARLCAFTNEGPYNRFVEWSGFTVSVEADLVGQINELTLLVEELQLSLDSHDGNLSQHDQDVKSLIASLEGKVDENNAAILESIRLLLTPQGQRESDLVDCNDEPGCDFPGGKN